MKYLYAETKQRQRQSNCMLAFICTVKANWPETKLITLIVKWLTAKQMDGFSHGVHGYPKFHASSIKIDGYKLMSLVSSVSFFFHRC